MISMEPKYGFVRKELRMSKLKCTIKEKALAKIKKDIENSRDLAEASEKFVAYQNEIKKAYEDFLHNLCQESLASRL